MHASRMKPETHWRNVGATIARRGGSLADLDPIKTGRPSIDALILDGFVRAERKIIRAASKERLQELDAAIGQEQQIKHLREALTQCVDRLERISAGKPTQIDSALALALAALAATNPARREP